MSIDHDRARMADFARTAVAEAFRPPDDPRIEDLAIAIGRPTTDPGHRRLLAAMDAEPPVACCGCGSTHVTYHATIDPGWFCRDCLEWTPLHEPSRG